MSGLLGLSLESITINAGALPSSSLELIDMILSEKATGPLADIIINRYARGYEDVELDRELVKEVRSILDNSFSNADRLVKTACANIEENKGHCYIARNREDARRIVGDIVGEGKTVIESLNWVVEETGVGESLAASNNVWNAALPIIVADLLNGRVSVSSLSKALEEMGVNVRGDLVSSVTSFYREKLYRADVGITGVAALASDPGALAFLSESGIDRLTTMTPEVHIALVGIDQVVESYSDAFKVSNFLMKANKGYYSFFGVIGGPSKTGDIEKRVTYGAHGPRELHVIILDDGRSDALSDNVLREGLSCLMPSKLPFREIWPIWKRIIGLGSVEPVRLPKSCPLSEQGSFKG